MFYTACTENIRVCLKYDKKQREKFVVFKFSRIFALA